MSSLLWLLCLGFIPIALCDDCNQVKSDTRMCSEEGQVCIVQTQTIVQSNAGLVLICRGGLWGTVATEVLTVPWSNKNTQVACRQAGFSGALNSMYPLTVSFSELATSLPVHYFGVSCHGSESSLLECTIIDASISQTSNTRAVLVVCRPETTGTDYSDVHEPGARTGDLRLYGDRNNGWGAVEVYNIGVGWVSICPDGFDNDDALVVCKQFGYEIGTSTSYSISAQAFSSPRLLYNAECTDVGPSNIDVVSETVIAGKCRFLSTSFCPSGSSQYGGVVCSSRLDRDDGSIRLLGSNAVTSGLTSGIVEVLYDGRWGMVCDGNMFALNEARAVCEQLDLDEDEASIMSPNSLLDEESRMKAIWLTGVNCGTSDDVFTACQRLSPIGYGGCSGSQQIVAVRCGSPSDGGFSSAGTTGIIIAVIFVIFFLIPLGYFFGRGYWQKRHDYSWYNTLTTPSEWCDCSSSPSEWCDCCTVTPRRTFELQQEVTVEAPVTTNTEPAHELAFGGFGRPSDSAAANEPSPETNEENPGLSEAPPPAYNTSENFPSLTSKPQDLPPPYAGPTVGFVFPPTTLNGATAPPPAATAPPTAGYDGYPPQASNQDPAYPPPTAPPPSTGYPQDPAYPPPPPLSGQELPYPVNIEYGGGAYPPPTVQRDSSDS